jgi:hypothetical protein
MNHRPNDPGIESHGPDSFESIDPIVMTFLVVRHHHPGVKPVDRSEGPEVVQMADQVPAASGWFFTYEKLDRMKLCDPCACHACRVFGDMVGCTHFTYCDTPIARMSALDWTEW